MLIENATAKEFYERFVTRVIESRKVWGLKNANGWAVCGSNDDEQRTVFPFWSDAAYATRCAKEDWDGYSAASIDLPAFMEHWLHGMNKDKALIGPNWDGNLCGLEVEPLELLQRLNDCK